MPTRREAMLAAGAFAIAPAAASAQTPAPIRVLRGAIEASSGAQYAYELGLFKKYGVDVTVEIVNSGEVGSAAIVGGAAQIGSANVLSLAVAHTKGVPFVFVAPGSQFVKNAPTAALIVSRATALRSAKDFAGKTIAIPALGDLGTISTQAWLDKSGVDSRSVRFVEVPNPQMTAAVERGTVDGALLSSPALEAALGTCKIFGVPYAAIADAFLVNAWYARADWVTAHRDAVRAFARAIVEAQDWAVHNREASGKMLATFNKVDPAVVARMTRTSYAPRLDPQAIQPVIDAAARYGSIPATFAATELIATG